MRLPDTLDAAQALEQEFLEAAIEHTRKTPVHLAGEAECRRCGEWNDRAAAGYAVCSDCVAQAIDGSAR